MPSLHLRVGPAIVLAGLFALAPQAAAPVLASPGDTHPVQLAALFGKSDEEKAAEEAAIQREQAQEANIQSLLRKVRDLEETNRRLTGQTELLGHRIEELQTKIAHTQKDFEYRLCAFAAQQLGAQSGEQQAPGLDCPGTQQGAAHPEGDPASPPHDSDTSHLAPPPGVLGTLPQGNAHPSDGDTVAPGSGPHAQYNSAMSLLAKANYAEARSAFQEFADGNPKDALAPQAIYWVGDIAYVQKDYPGAARAFAQAIKRYPSSPRGAESMLKLGQSLLAMGQKQEGCTTLGALPSKYPDASPAVAAKATAARKAATCR